MLQGRPHIPGIVDQGKRDHIFGGDSILFWYFLILLVLMLLFDWFLFFERERGKVNMELDVLEGEVNLGRRGI